MNKKGFTLVELLAVIVILAVILTLTIPNILGSTNSVKEKMLKTKIELIVSQAEIYANDNLKAMLQLPTKNVDNSIFNYQVSKKEDYPYGYKTVSDLANLGYLEFDTTGVVTNPLSSNSMNNVIVKFYANNKKNRLFADIICTDPTAFPEVNSETTDTSREVCNKAMNNE